LVWKI